MTKKVKVKFLVSRVVKDGHEGTPKETRFEEGKTYSLEPESADRWVRREVAEFVAPKSKAKSESSGADKEGDISGDESDASPNAEADEDSGDESADPPLDDLLGGDQSDDAKSDG